MSAIPLYRDGDNLKKIMAEEKKYPKVVVGAFIFNDHNELFLMKSPKWRDQYICPGGAVELGETLTDAVKREVKEETDMEIERIEFLAVVDGYDVNDGYGKDDNHLIFLSYRTQARAADKIKLNEEGTKYKWRKVEDWSRDKNVQRHTKVIIDDYLLNVEKENLNKKENDWQDKYLRALADYQNLLKRTAREKTEFVKYANQDLIQSIIPVYDNLKMSLAHIDETAEKNGWLEGIQHIIRQFKDILESLGVEEIKTVGEKFDPAAMEAIEGRGEIVKAEARPGYKLNGKVIVAAKVIVN